MSASEPDHFDSQSEGPQSVRGCCMRQPGGCHVAPEQEWKFPVSHRALVSVTANGVPRSWLLTAGNGSARHIRPSRRVNKPSG